MRVRHPAGQRPHLPCWRPRAIVTQRALPAILPPESRPDHLQENMNSFNLTGGGGPGPPFKCRFELFTRGQTAAKLRPWQRPAPGHSTSHFHSFVFLSAGAGSQYWDTRIRPSAPLKIPALLLWSNPQQCQSGLSSWRRLVEGPSILRPWPAQGMFGSCMKRKHQNVWGCSALLRGAD